MLYLKAVLSGIIAVIATELLTIWWLFRPWSSQKAIGIDALFAVMKASLVTPSPGYW